MKPSRQRTALVPDWSGGTRIGEALHRFNHEWARRVLDRGPDVVIVSDGWDQGDPELIAREAARLQRTCHRLVWLHPLAGTPGFEAANPRPDRGIAVRGRAPARWDARRARGRGALAAPSKATYRGAASPDSPSPALPSSNTWADSAPYAPAAVGTQPIVGQVAAPPDPLEIVGDLRVLDNPLHAARAHLEQPHTILFEGHRHVAAIG